MVRLMLWRVEIVYDKRTRFLIEVERLGKKYLVPANRFKG